MLYGHDLEHPHNVLVRNNPSSWIFSLNTASNGVIIEGLTPDVAILCGVKRSESEQGHASEASVLRSSPTLSFSLYYAITQFEAQSTVQILCFFSPPITFFNKEYETHRHFCQSSKDSVVASHKQAILDCFTTTTEWRVQVWIWD